MQKKQQQAYPGGLSQTDGDAFSGLFCYSVDLPEELENQVALCSVRSFCASSEEEYH